MTKESKVVELLPGVALAFGVAIISYGLHWLMPLISSLLFAIILGMLLRNTKLIPERANPGIAFSAKTVLRLGVVLLGFKLSLPEVYSLGWRPLVIIAVTVTAVYAITLLIGKWMKVPHTVRVLTATGTAICGAAAVAGMSSVVKRHKHNDEDIQSAAATAVASVTLFGTLSLLVLPGLLQTGLVHLTDLQQGIWTGASIHEVGQVVAAADFAGGGEITKTATVVKLGRVALLAPMVAIVGYLEARHLLAHKYDDEPNMSNRTTRQPILPYFVLGFLATMIIRSVLPFDYLNPVWSGIDTVATFILTAAMMAMGAGVVIKTIVKTGLRALALGLIAALVAGCLSLALIYVLW